MDENSKDETLKRTHLLTVLLVLSFIGGGLGFLSNMAIYLLHDEMLAVLSAQNMQSFMGVDVAQLLSVNPLLFLSQAIFLALSVVGAIMMWQLNRSGFHVYTISQIVLLILPKLFISGIPFPWFELSLSFLFVYLYAKSLKFF